MLLGEMAESRVGAGSREMLEKETEKRGKEGERKGKGKEGEKKRKQKPDRHTSAKRSRSASTAVFCSWRVCSWCDALEVTHSLCGLPPPNSVTSVRLCEKRQTNSS